MFNDIYLPKELWNMVYYYSLLDVLNNLSVVNKHINKDLSLQQFWLNYIDFNHIKLIDTFINYHTSKEWINEINYVKYITNCIDCILNRSKLKSLKFLSGRMGPAGLDIPLRKVDICALINNKMTEHLSSYRYINFLNELEKLNGKHTDIIELNINYLSFEDPQNLQMIATVRFRAFGRLIVREPLTDREIQSLAYVIFKTYYKS